MSRVSREHKVKPVSKDCKVKPVFKDYKVKPVSKDYKVKLDAELKAMRESEMWRAGAAVRSLRPENWKEKE